VPDLVGRSLDDATATLRSLGIPYAIQERESSDTGPDTVIEQSPSAGELVMPGSEVLLIVSGHGRELTVPDVVGFQVDAVQQGIESSGLKVNLDSVWSGKPTGEIVRQEPRGGTSARTGDVISLTVSGGTDIPIRLDVVLADMFVLESAYLDQDAFRRGDAITLRLRWLPRRGTDVRYSVFVHLIGPDGNLISQRDEEPAVPTSEWVPNRISIDQHAVTVPEAAGAGVHELRVGMYPPGEPASRLPVLDAGRTSVVANSILIAEVEILP
jgi:serine/threonine-protein kinase